MSDEFHLSSLVVYAAPLAAAAVGKAIGYLDGAELHAITTEGRLVVTLETATEQEALARVSEIGRLAGVASVALVYHHIESGPAQQGSATP